jgi:hypothetical protein
MVYLDVGDVKYRRRRVHLRTLSHRSRNFYWPNDSELVQKFDYDTSFISLAENFAKQGLVPSEAQDGFRPRKK